MIIVSANNDKNWSSIFPWLISTGDFGPIGVKYIYATGVEFRESEESEKVGAGFGCRVVADCKHTTHEDRAPAGLHLQQVFFDDSDTKNPVFRRKFDHETIQVCHHLVLEQNGDMWVVL
jgi:hypothetical protein